MLYASTDETYEMCDSAQDRNRLDGTIPRITQKLAGADNPSPPPGGRLPPLGGTL